MSKVAQRVSQLLGQDDPTARELCLDVLAAVSFAVGGGGLPLSILQDVARSLRSPFLAVRAYREPGGGGGGDEQTRKNTDRHERTDRPVDKQTNRPTDGQTYEHTERPTFVFSHEKKSNISRN